MSEDHKFLRKIFSEAVEIADARGRADYIVQACGDNAALRQQNDVLLEAHETSWKFPNRAEVRGWKRTFAAVSVTAFAAIVGLMVSTWSLVKERKAREQAEVAERQQSQSISQFLSSMLSGTDLNQDAPRRDPGALREILEDTTRRMRAEKDLPAAMSGSNATWGDFSSAGEHSNTMSFLLQRQQFLVARSLEGLALVRIQQNELDAAAELFRDSWEIRKKLFDPGTAERDSELNSTLSCLACVLLKQGKPDEAESLFSALNERDKSMVMARVGFRYATGDIVTRDDIKAVDWYRKAADSGWVPAQNALGRMYSEGRGVAKDEAEAAQWFRKAAESKDSRTRTP